MNIGAIFIHRDNNDNHECNAEALTRLYASMVCRDAEGGCNLNSAG